MKRDTSQVKFTTILAEFTPASILGVSAGNGQSSGGWVTNDKNSDGDAQYIRNDRNAWDALYSTTPQEEQ
jgi:hypothetical protein